MVVSAGAVIARSMLVVRVTHFVVVASADTACTMVVRTVVSAYDGTVGVVSTFAAGVVSMFWVPDGWKVGIDFANGLGDTTWRSVVVIVVHSVEVASAATARTNVVNTLVIEGSVCVELVTAAGCAVDAGAGDVSTLEAFALGFAAGDEAWAADDWAADELETLDELGAADEPLAEDDDAMAVDDEVMSAVEVWAADDTSLDEFVEPEELAAEGEDSAVEGMGSTEEVCVDNASAVVDSTADDTVEVVSAGTVSVVMMLGLLMNVSVCVGL
jgi:hypothetical protein